MAVAFIPFNAFSPGGSNFGDQLADVRNAIPLYGAYGPLRAKTVVSTKAGVGPVNGAYCHVFPSGIGTGAYTADLRTVLCGTLGKLYDTTANPWTEIGAGYGAASSPGGWRFASFGNDVWATNGIDPTQRRTNNAGNFAAGITSTFKPAGRFIGVVREFMFQVSLSNAGRFADEFCWSDSNDATWYDDRTGARPASLAGSKRIVSRPGQLTGFVGGEFGIFFKRRSIHALQFTAGSDVWRLDEISHGVGCALPGSLIAGSDANYFFGGDGFYSQSGLNAPQKISPSEIDQIFTDPAHFVDIGFSHDAMTALADEDSLMVGAEDSATGLKFWFYRTAGLSGPANPFQAGVVYDPVSQLWSRIDGTATFNFLNVAFLVARPDNFTASTSVDTVRLAGFDWDTVDSHMFTFSGPHEAAQLVTQRQAINFQASYNNPALSPTGRYRLNGVLPIFTTPTNDTSGNTPSAVANVSVLVRVANEPQFVELRDDFGSPVTPRFEQYDLTVANDWGWLPHSVEGRIWEFTVNIPFAAEWRNLTGLWINGEPIG